MDIELLYKKLEGTLTPQEKLLVNNWLEESPLHRNYWEQLKRSRGGEGYTLTQAEYKRYRTQFLEKMAQKMKLTRGPHFSLKTTLRYAAAVAAVVALSGLAYWGSGRIGSWFRTETPQQTVAQTTASPDTTSAIQTTQPKVSNRKVVLHTANGTTINLKDMNRKTVAGAQYDKSQELLSYQSAHTSKQAAATWNELEISRGADFQLILSDGTRVWLNSDTKLKYPTTFEGKERRVELTGEAYFEVTKDAEHPFVVSIRGMDVKVHGTEFNVNTRYRGKVATTLVTGSVSIIPQNEHETLLTPGHTAEYSPISHQVEVNQKDILLYTGWKEGVYQFEETTLEDMFQEISHWYDIRVTFADEAVKQEAFTGVISRSSSLKKILNLLAKTNYIEYTIKGNNIEIKKANY